MKIVFISSQDPHNRIARSGVPYSIYHQLAKDNEMIWIKPDLNHGMAKVYNEILHLFYGLLRKIFGWNVMHTPAKSKLLCKSIQKQLDRVDYDCIFTMGSPETAYLKTAKPIFCRTDAIIQSFPDYYIYNVPKFARKWADKVERKALSNYTRFFVPSQWVIDEIKKFHINEPLDKFVLVETGANLDMDYICCNKHTYSLEKPLNMLLVGYDVKRKGIDEAFVATKILNEQYHIEAKLTVVGGKPEQYMLDSGFVRYAGNKNKNNKKELDEFYDEFAKADLFIFPTKAECHGIVNCEAAAYGLPIFSYQTGGVPSYCIDGVNGRCLSLSATGSDFADAIYGALKNGQLNLFSEASCKLFKERFNWDVWGEKVRRIMIKDIKGN